MARILFLGLSIAVLAAPVSAQTDCRPTLGGAYSCYDHDRGVFVDISPRLGGGYSVYDYETGGYRDVLRDFGQRYPARVTAAAFWRGFSRPIPAPMPVGATARRCG